MDQCFFGKNQREAFVPILAELVNIAVHSAHAPSALPLYLALVYHH